jgi:hypothetical protein
MNLDENYHQEEKMILLSDSVLIKQKTVNPGYLSPHINIGYERIFGARKLKWFYGADLSFGYSENETFIQNTEMRRDTSMNSVIWADWMDHTVVAAKMKTKTTSFGISPFFGVKYPVSKRFSVSAQVGVDAVCRNQFSSATMPGYFHTGHFITFDFNQDTGFLNDISIIYKF